MNLHNNIDALELSKVLERLAALTCCEDAAALARNLKPFSDPDEVKAEIAKTCEALSLSGQYGTPQFLRMVNPTAACKRSVSGAVLTPRELLDIAAVLRQGRYLEEWRDKYEAQPEQLEELLEQTYANRYLEQRIDSVFISEDEMADDASPELAQIRRKIRNTEQKIREQLEKILHSASYQKILQEQLVTQRDGRFVVPVKSEQRQQLPGLVHDTSASGATLFVEPMSVVEANNRIRQLQGQERDEMQRILTELSEETALYCDSIIAGYHAAVLLNVLFSKANLAAQMKAAPPVIRTDGKTILHKARHPLIPDNRVVPIDISLGGDFQTLVITGPNTGGKTVALKTLGLLTLMTMCGLLIPAADGSEVSVFSKVLADIGDEQSIEQSLSTFSAHMTRVISILSEADDNTLVLLDELGAGTDPVEGAALAVAVLERLRQLGAKTAASTHYAELKLYALETDGVENASCEFDISTLTPTYRLLLGTPGRSNAFAISKKLGLPDEVLEAAQAQVAGENRHFEEVTEKLEISRRSLENERAELQKQRSELSVKEKRLQQELSKMEERSKAAQRKAQEEANRLVSDVRRRSEQLMAELEEIRQDKDKEDFSKRTKEMRSTLRGKLNRLSDMASPVEETSPEEYTLPRPLVKGDEVLLVDLGQTGTVLAPADSSGKVDLQVGSMRMRVPTERLQLNSGQKQKQKAARLPAVCPRNPNARSKWIWICGE